MRRNLIIFGFVLFVFGVALGLYASQRNCLIAFVTSGYMSFWTTIEILGGFIALVGLIIALFALMKRMNV